MGKMNTKFIKDCIKKAENHKSNLERNVLELPGMSSAKVRHLLNNLCEGRKYLEVGTYRGSTLISACYNNNAKGLAYDDYRRFGNHYDEVLKKIKIFEIDAELKNKDGFSHTGRQKYDVIFYDGDHSYESTKKAINYFFPYVKKGGVLIIDDYEYIETKKAVDESKLDLILLRANSKNTRPVKFDVDGWWNGLAIITK